MSGSGQVFPRKSSEGGYVLPSEASWQRLRRGLSPIHHERLDRVRFTAEKIGADRLGIDFELLLLLHESHSDATNHLAQILPNQENRLKSSLENLLKKNRTSQIKRNPDWIFKTLVGSGFTLVFAGLLAVTTTIDRRLHLAEASIRDTVAVNSLSLHANMDEEGAATRKFFTERTSLKIDLMLNNDGSYKVYVKDSTAPEGGYWQHANVTIR